MTTGGRIAALAAVVGVILLARRRLARAFTRRTGTWVGPSSP
jgi:hypothetical protein